MRPHANHTKIIATLGPATSDEESIAKLLDAGVDVCRLNFSHGELAGHQQRLDLVRRLAAQRGRPVAVLGDLCGPKIRLNAVAGATVELKTGQPLRIVRGDADCTAATLTTNYARLIDEIEVGHRILIDDGLVRLLIVERRPDELDCVCTVGGAISSRKGVNFPDTRISAPAFTDKDRRDAEWAIQHQLDYVALSFVRHPDDLQELRELLRRTRSDVGIVVKIEKKEALDYLDELIAQCDAVMVARGDLGVEMDVWKVPLVQKDITRRCRAAGVPVIIATQMLQSMVGNPTPTRAEVSDVANAILDHTDAVMLSAETASGEYPALAVDMMQKVADVTEAYLREHVRPFADARVRAGELGATHAVAHAAVQAARGVGARVVAVWTATGATARMVAQHRLSIPVVALSPDERVGRRLNLLYGVVPIRVDPLGNPAALVSVVELRLLERKLARPGDWIVFVTSTRPTVAGATDTTLVHRVGER
ncbi:MAG: pyruvate kinase [Phycisphaerae bacterium]